MSFRNTLPANPALSLNPKGIANFRKITTVVDSVNDEKSLARVKDKAEFGGSDVGFGGSLNGIEYIVKIGVSLSLLSRTLKKHVAGDTEKENKFLGFFVGDVLRIVGTKWDDHAPLKNIVAEQKIDTSNIKLEDYLKSELKTAWAEFKKTALGIAMIEQMKKNQALTVEEVYQIYRDLASKNALLRELFGLAAMSDIFKGAHGQLLNNTYQERLVDSSKLDDNRLLVEKTGQGTMIFMASRVIPGAVAFDKFLLEPFLTNKIENFSSKEEWLAKCKADLSSRLTNLNGLASAILIRHMTGESADLGPDNMLIVTDKDKQNIINIDITGFRFPRRNVFEEPTTKELRYGWEDTLKSQDADVLTERLLSKSVFSKRFVMDSAEMDKLAKDNKTVKDDVMKAITEVLSEKIKMNAVNEVHDVREWLTTLPFDLIASSLKEATEEVYSMIDSGVRPNAFYRDKLIAKNISFIDDYNAVVQSLEKQPSLTFG